MQQVCLNCGYNIVGYNPDHCPFCGASKNQFIAAEECSRKYEIKEDNVNEKISRLNSFPRLGLEHAAYQIKTKKGTIMIDCPSTFRSEITPADYILFTHHHFLGASNLYRKHFSSNLWINSADAKNLLTKNYIFDKKFESNFKLWDLHSYHINGHTSGFTFYIYEDTLFTCDYVFVHSEQLRFNPYGPYQETVKGGEKMREIINNFDLNYVCGYNYVLDFKKWSKKFNFLLSNS